VLAGGVVADALVEVALAAQPPGKTKEDKANPPTVSPAFFRNSLRESSAGLFDFRSFMVLLLF